MPPTLEEYEAFIYALPARYPVIQHAVLSFIRLGPLTATVRAELFFAREVVLHVRQTLDFAEGFIQSYSYEVYLRRGKAVLVRLVAASPPCRAGGDRSAPQTCPS